MKKLLPVFLVLSLAACSPAAPAMHDMAAIDHTGMTMDDMVNGLDGLEGDDFDKAFLEMMIPHHQGAIDMAELVLLNAKHDELKEMARAIISAQQTEIDQMRQWMSDWGYSQ